MQRFTIRNIEILTGIKSHTLRVWEARYSFFAAQRKESNQRFYDNEDLKKLLCLSFLYHNSWKISKIASLSDQELIDEVGKIELSDSNYKSYVQQLLQAAIDFNEAAFTEVVNALTQKIGFEKVVIEVCYPFLQRVGLLWDTNKVIPAQEHFSSYLIQSRVISETEKYSASQYKPPEVVLFCPENEYHELPLLYLNYLLRKYGWPVLYLGTNIKIADLKEAVVASGVKFIYLHSITNFTGYAIDDYLELLRKAFPDKVIIASGRGVQDHQRSFVNMHLLKRDEDIYRFIKERKHQALGST